MSSSTSRGRRQRILGVETLEHRCLPSSTPWPAGLVPQRAAGPIPSLDRAAVLQLLPVAGGGAVLQAGAAGTIHNDAAGGGGVDWYQFTLTGASAVVLTTADGLDGNPLASTLTLYNTEAPDPNYPFDFSSPPFDPLGHRLLAQDDGAGHGGDTRVSRELAPGTYFVAVSGSGNRDFHPFLADSGYAGSTGNYRLLVTATDLGLTATDGPAVLAVEPATTVHASPLVVRVDLSAAIDPTTVTLAQPWSSPTDPPPTVQLTFNPTGNFGDGNDQIVYLAGFHFSPDAAELQLKPLAPLTPGYYRLFLAGDSAGGQLPVLTDPTDTLNLGQDATHAGQDFTATFQIDAGQTSDDTAATANDLGDLTAAGRVRVTGAIGDDPALADNPAAEVDLYHFQISGAGLHAFSAEVFAGRIGSTLDPALSLFRPDPTDPAHRLVLIASNDISRNDTLTSDGSARPLFTDPVLFAGLPAGDYYLAVSGTQNAFDPNVSQSGTAGFTTGDYVLNVLVQPALPSPRVLSAGPSNITSADAPPTQLTVHFDSPVNVVQLAAAAFDATNDSTIAGVFIVGPNGQKYFPRLESYDSATNEATFLMLDALPAGVNALHLSGAGGLTGFGGNPLLGNDPNNPAGDYVTYFTVTAAPRGTVGNPLLWQEQEPNDSADAPQDLGVLFPHELQAGVTIQGSLTPGAGGTADGDYYRIEVLQYQEYLFGFTGAGAQMTITDTAGTPVMPLSQDDPNNLHVLLAAGTYLIHVSGPPAAGPVGYEIQVMLLGDSENPPPLTAGAAPALRIRLADSTPPPVTPTPPTQVSLPSPPPPAGTTGTVLSSNVLVNLTNLTLAPSARDLTKALTDTTGVVAAGQVPVIANIPLDATLALRAAPVGGVTNNGTGPTAGPDQAGIAVLPPLAVPLVTFATPGTATGGDGSALGEWRSTIAALIPLWQRLVDMLFATEARETPSPARGPAEVPGQEMTPAAGGNEEELSALGQQVGDLTWDRFVTCLELRQVTNLSHEGGTRPGGWATAAGLVAGILFGAVPPRERLAPEESPGRARGRERTAR